MLPHPSDSPIGSPVAPKSTRVRWDSDLQAFFDFAWDTHEGFDTFQ